MQYQDFEYDRILWVRECWGWEGRDILGLALLIWEEDWIDVWGLRRLGCKGSGDLADDVGIRGFIYGGGVSR